MGIRGLPLFALAWLSSRLRSELRCACNLSRHSAATAVQPSAVSRKGSCRFPGQILIKSFWAARAYRHGASNRTAQASQAQAHAVSRQAVNATACL